MHDMIPNILMAIAAIAALIGFAIAGLGGALGLIDPPSAVIFCAVCLGGVALAVSRIEA